MGFSRFFGVGCLVPMRNDDAPKNVGWLQLDFNCNVRNFGVAQCGEGKSAAANILTLFTYFFQEVFSSYGADIFALALP